MFDLVHANSYLLILLFFGILEFATGKFFHPNASPDEAKIELAALLTLLVGRPLAYARDAFQLLAKARPGTAKLTVNGEEVATRHLTNFGGFRSAATETLDIGKDTDSPVSNDYSSAFDFTGKIAKVEINLAP